jgi:N-methylhydantoinase A/oxoprolinase/acetone carboxylase beta subunit
MQKYIIGIDTGGTFTDAVLLERSTGRVIQTAKAPTTHSFLADGVSDALTDLLQSSNVEAGAIDTVAISSTLATNAVVENKGARVAVFVIGYVKHFKLPVKAVLFLKGGHTITGEEEEPLDLEYLTSLPQHLSEEVDAYGICAAMSFKNPTHELVAEKAITMLDPKPVFCSHRVSSHAGMEERAATAGLHAKLMPLMQEFIEAIDHGLKNVGISSRIAIVSGSGSALAPDEAIKNAGMTVASGPACTALFGAGHTEEDSIIVDVGGTTTDITMIRGGTPLMAKEGSHIGGWRTHVEAIDMSTRGIGGDSHVVLDDKNRCAIGPRRVVPLATSSCTADIDSWLGREDRSKCIDLVPSVRHDLGKTDNDSNRIVSILRQNGPCTLAELKPSTGLSGMPLDKLLEDLSRRQAIYETGFTPTDALHVLGHISLGDGSKSMRAAAILGDHLGVSAEQFAHMVIEQTVEKIESAILEYLGEHFWGKSLAAFIAGRNDQPVLGVDFSLKVPMIGIGAAARFFLPDVAQRLGTTVDFPENYEVGNGVGAALKLLQNSD